MNKSNCRNLLFTVLVVTTAAVLIAFANVRLTSMYQLMDTSDRKHPNHVGYFRFANEYGTSNNTYSSTESLHDVKTDTTPPAASDRNEDMGSIPACPEQRPVVYTNDGQRRIPSELYQMAPTVFDKVPTHFIKGLRNPCWKEADDMICLPFFFLAGFPKSGTTDLYAKISQHHHVANVKKEPHYWTRTRIDYKMKLEQYSSTSWYDRVFDDTAVNDTLKRKLIVGDYSASTIWDHHHWLDYFSFDACKQPGPPYVIADIIHTVLPKSKLLVLLRNPMDRLYSDSAYFARAKPKVTPDSFHRHVTETIERFNACLQIASYRSCAYSPKLINNTAPSVRLHIGLYSIYVRDWWKVFPRDQFMFLRLEDWHGKCPDILPHVFTFLELKSLPPSKILTICKRGISNRFKGYTGKMLNETRAILDRFYLRSNQELAEILADDKFLWN